MIQWLFISGYVLQNMLQVGFVKTFQNLPYFEQSVAYVHCIAFHDQEAHWDVPTAMSHLWAFSHLY